MGSALRRTNQVRVCHGTEDKTLENQSPADLSMAEESNAWLSPGFLGRLVKVRHRPLGVLYLRSTYMCLLTPLLFLGEDVSR